MERTHHIYLVQGFLGFAHLGRLTYFGHVRRLLTERLTALGGSLTGSRGFDEYLAMRALEARSEEPPLPAAAADVAAPPQTVFEALLECSV